MKDKEKQIEEMAKELIIAFGWKFGRPNEFEYIAEYLVEQRYQKLTKDDVVLSREEYDILTKDIEHPTDEVLKKLVVGKNLLTKQVIEKTRKETADKLIKFVSEHCDNETLIWQLDEFVAKQLCVETEIQE